MLRLVDVGSRPPPGTITRFRSPLETNASAEPSQAWWRSAWLVAVTTVATRRDARHVTGTVTLVAGVVLDARGVRWALGGSAEMEPGTEITVTGRPTGLVADACGDAILRVTEVDAG